jgi:hypothetical protein
VVFGAALGDVPHEYLIDRPGPGSTANSGIDTHRAPATFELGPRIAASARSTRGRTLWREYLRLPESRAMPW